MKAAYSIDADVMVEGLSGKIRVTDEDGKPASGVEIFLSDDDNTLIGKTNANGVLLPTSSVRRQETNTSCMRRKTAHIHMSTG